MHKIGEKAQNILRKDEIYFAISLLIFEHLEPIFNTARAT